jgi:hypothetical protein
MTSDPRRVPKLRRLLSLLALIAMLAAGCGDSDAKKPDAPPVEPQAQKPEQTPQKGLPPGGNKME